MAYKQLKLWFDKDLALLLCNKILTVDPNFAGADFVKIIDYKVSFLELKDRVELIADQLYLHFDSNYKKGINILLQILGPENPNEIGMFKEYYWVMPIAKYIEKYGLQHFELSMKSIEEVTKRNTGEYAIRPYLAHETDRTLAQMTKWSRHPNKHVRRLSSEGVRPRLPWAKKLEAFIIDPKPILPILNNLKDDDSKYVQKSVANCINDIIKDNSDIARLLIEKWHIGKMSPQRKWIIKHALRNLLKSGDTWAIEKISDIS
jgi:DNA alkylation repair enzyme